MLCACDQNHHLAPASFDIPYSHMLAAEVVGPTCTEVYSSRSYSVTLHYVKSLSNNRLRVSSLEVQSDFDKCTNLAKQLEEQMTVTERPKRLVVIINPNSGKKRAEKVFKTKVQPVFSLCGIHSTVIVTSAPKEARELLQTLDLADVDGVVTVGGDGLYYEVMNGLLLRTQKDHGVNADDPEAEIIPTDIPIGIIPAGSGDWVVQYLQGTRDVITSALHVVLGKTSLTNAVSVHQGGKLSAYAGLVLGFGLQGDIMNDCEKFRWMGPSRYSVVPVSTVLSRQAFDVEVEYQDDVTGDVKRISDQMYGVDTYIISKAGQDKLKPDIERI
nr:hypothetical protein BaRGS_008968 [Batillaria attramentaria]